MEDKFFEQVCVEFMNKMRQRRRRGKVRMRMLMRLIRDISEEASISRDEALESCFPELGMGGEYVYPFERFFTKLLSKNYSRHLRSLWRRADSEIHPEVDLYVSRMINKLDGTAYQ